MYIENAATFFSQASGGYYLLHITKVANAEL